MTGLERAALRVSIDRKMRGPNTPQVGDLQVWHIPQVPGKPFKVRVSSPEEAIKILEILADYDLFQLAHNIKPDYCNTQGLHVYTEDGWEDWYSEDGTMDIDQFAKYLIGEDEEGALSSTPEGVQP